MNAKIYQNNVFYCVVKSANNYLQVKLLGIYSSITPQVQPYSGVRPLKFCCTSKQDLCLHQSEIYCFTTEELWPTHLSNCGNLLPETARQSGEKNGKISIRTVQQNKHAYMVNTHYVIKKMDSPAFFYEEIPTSG